MTEHTDVYLDIRADARPDTLTDIEAVLAGAGYEVEWRLDSGRAAIVWSGRDDTDPRGDSDV